MKAIYLTLALILLSSFVSGDSQYVLEWQDIFPMCAKDSENYNSLRCGAEFLVPNLHLGLIYSTFTNTITSFFLINDVANFFNSFMIDPVQAVGGILTNIYNTVKDFFLVSDNDSSAGDILTGLFEGIISWFLGVVTPFFILIMLMFIEFIKSYLLVAIPFNLWIFFLLEVNLINNANGLSGVHIAVLTILIMFICSIWILGSDLGLYSLLVVI